MRFIKAYKPFVDTKSQFMDKFDSEETKELAEQCYNSIDAGSFYIFIFMVVITIVLCVFYFTLYNNLPGRHYRRWHWAVFYIISVLTSFFGSSLIGWIIAKPAVSGYMSLVWDISLGNLVYSFLGFIVLSVVWWLFLPTNAYRLIGNK